ncbi:MAG TPA: 2-oxo acid dehydrogenase subunit E2, partial [Gemmatimonadaceae bacterium]|nr:2-oxo acid dehydrogenase subunit E2 [Gemmatimonadaceae bacterium]
MTAIKVPPLGESIVEATVSRWLKKEGDEVAPGDTLVELETDKITVEVPTMSAGVLTKRAHAEGDVVKVDDVLAEVDESASNGKPAESAEAKREAPGNAAAPGGSAPARPASQTAPAQAAGASTAPAASAARSGDVKASPAAKRIAAEQGVDLSKIEGTGRGGVVSKPDVVEQVGKAAAPQSASSQSPTQLEKPSATPAQRPAAAPATAAPRAPRPVPSGERETREKMSTRRKRISEHLLESQHATAHLTTFNEIDMSTVIGVRERLKERVEKEHGVKLSFMPFFVKAACQALKAYPVVNAQIDGDAILYKHYVNMGIAVASDAGLVVPNIKDADRMGMIEISRSVG